MRISGFLRNKLRNEMADQGTGQPPRRGVVVEAKSHSLTSGGEGGIRTLGTDVSPYNGLANGPFSPLLVFKRLQSDAWPPSRTQCLSSGSYCAPHCAPPNGSGLAMLHSSMHRHQVQLTTDSQKCRGRPKAQSARQRKQRVNDRKQGARPWPAESLYPAKAIL